MATRKSEGSLEKKLAKLQKQEGGTIKIESIVTLVDETVSSAMSDALKKDKSLIRELELLGQYIADAKSEIADLRPDEVKTQYLPDASGELDAIVKATEVATNEIMDATESIGEIGDAVGGDQGQAIFDATMRIYQACGFQDITGQRINKVVGTLKHIEDKVDALTEAFGDGAPKKSPKKKAKKSAKKPAKKSAGKKAKDKKIISDADLLDGPQLPDEAIKQDEIDALLASFD